MRALAARQRGVGVDGGRGRADAARLRAAPRPGPRRRRVLPAGHAGAADARRRPPAARPSRRGRAPAPGRRPCDRARTAGRRAVTDARGRSPRRRVVNAAGMWAGEVGRAGRRRLPILPRRGFILVTAAAAAAGAAQGLRGRATWPTWPATTATCRPRRSSRAPGRAPSSSAPAGSGSASTARVSLPVLRRLAAGAIRLFPVLAGCTAIRAYRGFRPYTPDHLPVIGADPRVPGPLPRLRPRGRRASGSPRRPASSRGDLLTGVAHRRGPEPVRAGALHDVHALTADQIPRRRARRSAAALLAGRHPLVADHPGRRPTAGFFCGIGVCFDCLVTRQRRAGPAGLPGARPLR